MWSACWTPTTFSFTGAWEDPAMLREIEELGRTRGVGTQILDRARGALYGLAVGDALGMPTQLLSRRQVAELYGRLEGFEPGPEINEISRGMPAGSVTD